MEKTYSTSVSSNQYFWSNRKQENKKQQYSFWPSVRESGLEYEALTVMQRTGDMKPLNSPNSILQQSTDHLINSAYFPANNPHPPPSGVFSRQVLTPEYRRQNINMLSFCQKMSFYV